VTNYCDIIYSKNLRLIKPKELEMNLLLGNYIPSNFCTNFSLHAMHLITYIPLYVPEQPMGK